MAAHCQICNELMNKMIASQKSTIITTEKYHRIVEYLKNPTIPVNAHFKHWVKTKGFYLYNEPALNIIDVLALRSKEDPEGADNCLRQIHSGQMYEVVKAVHESELKHPGYKKTLDHIKKKYVGITREYVQVYCRECPTCQLNQPQRTKPPLKPIVESEFLNRVQIDLIDMRGQKDGSYEYIGHFMDHFTKYHVLFPLVTKSAEEVTRMLRERVLAYVGAPRIFHTDNGKVSNNILNDM